MKEQVNGKLKNCINYFSIKCKLYSLTQFVPRVHTQTLIPVVVATRDKNGICLLLKQCSVKFPL